LSQAGFQAARFVLFNEVGFGGLVQGFVQRRQIFFGFLDFSGGDELPMLFDGLKKGLFFARVYLSPFFRFS